jgi:hypothetical protein
MRCCFCRSAAAVLTHSLHSVDLSCGCSLYVLRGAYLLLLCSSDQLSMSVLAEKWFPAAGLEPVKAYLLLPTPRVDLHMHQGSRPAVAELGFLARVPWWLKQCPCKQLCSALLRGLGQLLLPCMCRLK